MPLRFDELQREVFALYGQERFQEALEAVARALPELPEQAGRLMYWQACLYCRLERPDEALRVLQRGSDDGHWWSEHQLTGDPDLELLKDRPGLLAIATASSERLRAAQALARPGLEIVPPREPVERPPLLMAFHMRGGTMAATLPYWRPAADGNVLVAVPQSLQVTGPDAFCWDDGEAAKAQAYEAYRKVRSRYGFDPERLVLGGASQGAALALRLALQGLPAPSCGFISVVGAGPLEPWQDHLQSAAERGLRGVFITGEHDRQRVNIETVFAAVEAAGVPCRLEVVPGLGHDYPADFKERLHGALEFVLG